MIPAEYNITNQLEGDTFDYVQFNMIDVNSDPIDLTGIDIKIQFRRGYKDGDVVKTITDVSGITFVNRVLGQFYLTTFIIDWGHGTYFYDIQFTYSDGSVKTYVQGKVLVTKQVTI
jgi:hypothetical protein